MAISVTSTADGLANMIPPAGTEAFLTGHGWGDAQIAPLAGDASFRRYFRVSDGARRAVLMDAPPPHENAQPFLAIAAWLSSKGFAAPAIHAADVAQGLVLLEDFGDARMRETVDADTPARAATSASSASAWASTSR